MRIIRHLIATILLLVISSSANAFAVSWAFQDAFFDDGASLIGSFDFDADIGGAAGFSNLDLATSDGSLAGASYTGRVSPTSSATGFATFSGHSFLLVTLVDAMTNAGGTIDINPVYVSAELGFRPRFDWRVITAGSIASLAGLAGPAGDTGTIQLAEPTVLAIFILGLAAIIGLRTRRRVMI